MLIRTLPTISLQIFCKMIINSKVIIKSIIDPDDNFWRNSQVLMGYKSAIYYHYLIASIKLNIYFLPLTPGLEMKLSDGNGTREFPKQVSNQLMCCWKLISPWQAYHFFALKSVCWLDGNEHRIFPWCWFPLVCIVLVTYCGEWRHARWQIMLLLWVWRCWRYQFICVCVCGGGGGGGGVGCGVDIDILVSISLYCACDCCWMWRHAW